MTRLDPGCHDEWGEFDYIICHGVFSWVEPEVQDTILRIAHDNLSATRCRVCQLQHLSGLAPARERPPHDAVSRGRVRRPEGADRAGARAADVSRVHFDERGPYGQLLNREIERLSKASDSYLYHEHLEQTNAPLYFYQFIERAESAGLQYLSEADVRDMFTRPSPASISETLDQISPDLLHLEQYMDFVRNRHVSPDAAL